MIKVVGLAGYRGSGKSTAAQRFAAKHDFLITHLAGPIKEMLMALGFSRAELDDPVLKEKPSGKLCGRSPRFAMQTLGTEWGRNIVGNEIWLELWLRKVVKLIDQGHQVVVDDIRFKDEIEAVESLDGEVIWIGRTGYGASDHVTESDLVSLCGYAIINDGEIADLYQAVDRWVRQIARVR